MDGDRLTSWEMRVTCDALSWVEVVKASNTMVEMTVPPSCCGSSLGTKGGLTLTLRVRGDGGAGAKEGDPALWSMEEEDTEVGDESVPTGREIAWIPSRWRRFISQNTARTSGDSLLAIMVIFWHEGLCL